MTGQQKFRMTLDATMTVLSLILMGGNYFFPWDGVHEIVGVALLVLWAAHVWLNRRWYAALPKGRYSPWRGMQAAVNVLVLVCAVLLAVSGVMLSNHVFRFLHISAGMRFARTAHLLASHWYFLFMSMHIGMHAAMIAGSLHLARKDGTGARVWIPRAIVLLVSIYGVYAFFSRGVGGYLLLRQQFFFFDMEKGYVRFFIDYLCILTLFAAAAHCVARLLQRGGRRS